MPVSDAEWQGDGVLPGAPIPADLILRVRQYQEWAGLPSPMQRPCMVYLDSPQGKIDDATLLLATEERADHGACCRGLARGGNILIQAESCI